MLDRPIAAFDIETVPDPGVGRRLQGLAGTDAEVVAAMVEQRMAETEGRSGYPQLPHHRVVTIGMAWLDPQAGRFTFGTCGDGAMDEPSHLRGFFDRCGATARPVRLVSWNGAGFDLPIMRYRAMLHGIAAPDFYRTDGEWKWNNYQNRFHDMHVDLMDVLSGYGASHRVGLGTLATLLGLPDKSFLTKPIYDHIFDGEEHLVREYCKLDCVLTLLLYLHHTHHTGHLEPDQLLRHVATVCDALEADPFEGWGDIAAHLREWPTWAAGPEPSDAGLREAAFRSAR